MESSESLGLLEDLLIHIEGIHQLVGVPLDLVQLGDLVWLELPLLLLLLEIVGHELFAEEFLLELNIIGLVRVDPEHHWQLHLHVLPEDREFLWLVLEVWLELYLIESPEVVVLVGAFVPFPLLVLWLVGLVVLGFWIVLVPAFAHLLII